MSKTRFGLSVLLERWAPLPTNVLSTRPLLLPRLKMPFDSVLDRVLISTQFVRLWCSGTAGSIVRLCRTPVRINTLEEANQVWSGVVRALLGLDRKSLGLVIDFREARGRNDAEFERTVAPYRAEITKGFRRVAVLTKSLTGQMQVERLAREDRVAGLRCFDNETHAIEWLESSLAAEPAAGTRISRQNMPAVR